MLDFKKILAITFPHVSSLKDWLDFPERKKMDR